MKKALKIILVTLAALVLLVTTLGFVGYLYLNSTFLGFEGDYADVPELQELTIDGYTFVDRNGNGELDPYEDARLTTRDRVEDLLSRMTMDEKIHLLKGSGLGSAVGRVEPGTGVPGAVGTIVPTPRLGIPTLYLSDGPAGLRIQPRREGQERTFYATAFPIATQLASTWNTELVEEVGRAMGNEVLEYGIDVILGPGANIHRHPLTGRNFEYYSEDPVLTGKIGAAMVNGIESNGVGTSVKHFVANNQETDRTTNDAIVSERALREIYLKGFEIIVREAQPWTVMSSYNKVNGTYVTQSRELLTGVLRGEWGFGGVVVSDWFGGADAAAQIRAGNDLLEPGTRRQWNALLKAEANGTLSHEDIDTSVRRILDMIMGSRKMQGYVSSDTPDLEAHAAITRRSAAEGVVLLSNHDVLPLRDMKNIALIGVTSFNFISGGSGSGLVNAAYSVSLEEGLAKAGLEINALSRQAYDAFHAAHEEDFKKPEGMLALMEAFTPPEMTYTRAQLEEMAATSDTGILTIGRNAGEGSDRVEAGDFLLTSGELEMIETACEVFHAAGKPVVVVLNIGGVIETASWKDQPDAILLAWQGGQEGGHSVADVLTGRVSPSGKLPMTFPIRLGDHASDANFPKSGKPFSVTALLMGPRGEKPQAEKVRNEDYTLYEEGIYVGYRHFDTADLDVSYPFGHGLSYTEFEYRDLAVSVDSDSVHIAVDVWNTGNVAGKEAVQFYVSKPGSAVDRPVQELKAFAKTGVLEPGAMETLRAYIPVANLGYWDEEQGAWTLERGDYVLRAGASSRDIRQAAGFGL